MAFNPTAFGQRFAVHDDLVRVLVIVAAVLVLMIAMSFAFGVHAAGPYVVIPDPAVGPGMPF